MLILLNIVSQITNSVSHFVPNFITFTIQEPHGHKKKRDRPSSDCGQGNGEGGERGGDWCEGEGRDGVVLGTVGGRSVTGVWTEGTLRRLDRAGNRVLRGFEASNRTFSTLTKTP